MPLNTVSEQRHWLLMLWPLWIFLLCALLLVGVALHYWPQLFLHSVLWQRDANQQMATLMQQVGENPQRVGVTLMLVSLGYGILHAIGPGHGKVVITTYLATHPSRLKSSLQLTFAAAIVQGFVAILLVTVMLSVLKFSSRQLHQTSFWLERGSFVLVMMLGGMLCWRAGRRLYRTIRSRSVIPLPLMAAQPLVIRHQPLLASSDALQITQLHPLAVPKTHQHTKYCGCGHRHLPSDSELRASNSWRTRVMLVLAMGLRPCSGALLVLLFAQVVGVYLWGVLSALAMALGTAVTVSLLAIVVHHMRGLAMRMARDKTPALWQQIAWGTLALMGGTALFVAGLVLYLTNQSALINGIRPF